jgi:hypothetical protein
MRSMVKRFPIVPAHPERVCWGCDLYCPSDSLRCGNGTVRTAHPAELFGEDWMEWGLGVEGDGDGVGGDGVPAGASVLGG